MAKTDYRSIDEYIAAQPEAVRLVLERVRAVIGRALPKAEEGISYQIPVFRLGGKPVIYFAGWKKHFSIYPVTSGVLEACGEALAAYEMSKGTVRFPLGGRVPAGLIGRVAKARARETVAGRVGR